MMRSSFLCAVTIGLGVFTACGNKDSGADDSETASGGSGSATAGSGGTDGAAGSGSTMGSGSAMGAGGDGGASPASGGQGGSVDPTPDPPSAPRLFSSSLPILVKGAAMLGDKVVVVGNTRDDAILNESREGWAFSYDSEGVVSWSERIGDAGNDQLLDVAGSGDAIVIAGVSRGYSVGGANNNDALLVRATEAGLGDAFNWGTTDEELLYGVTAGGSLGAFVGVGEYRSGADPRQGLVIVFDTELKPTWAMTLDAGADDRFYDAVVVGNTVYAVGQSGEDLIVVALNDSGPLWARRAAGGGSSRGTAVSAVEGQIVVAGSLPRAGMPLEDPAVLRFGTDGVLAPSQRYSLEGSAAATGTHVIGGKTVVTGARWADQVSFLFSVEGGAASDAVALSGTQTAGFLRTPIVELAAEPRMLLVNWTEKVVDMPFNNVPEASCAETPIAVTATDVNADELSTISVTAGLLTLTGGIIENVRTGPLGTTGSDFICPAP